MTGAIFHEWLLSVEKKNDECKKMQNCSANQQLHTIPEYQ
jgi:hypothetical protein